MNNRFDELTKSLAQAVKRRQALKKFGVGLAGMALAGISAAPGGVSAAPLGPSIELSQLNPVGTCDDGFRPGGNWGPNDSAEPYVVTNPLQPDNVVAAWMGGFVQSVVAGVSFDGGRNWQQVPLPLTTCTGGAYLAAGDVWLSFAANGDLYASALVGNSFAAKLVVVCKSMDGGLHWSAPKFLTGSDSDHPSITADPIDSRFAYAIWDTGGSGGRSLSTFSRTTDGGLTWEAPRTLVQPASHNAIQFSQILVLPNGTLVDLYEQKYSTQEKKPWTQTTLQLVRSTDHGQTWSTPRIALILTPVYNPDTGSTLVVDPETGQTLMDPTNPSFAVDRRNGNLYAVWEEGRFSNFQYNDIAFSMSADGGLSWSSPIRVNQTPLSIPPLNRQAFLPAVGVAANGTVGVTYYDFRYNTPDPALPTDYWLVQWQPSADTPANDPASWGNEVRLTERSFNLEACFSWVGGIFVGDYFGLAGTARGFVAVFTQPDPNGFSSIFARRVGP